MNISNGADNLRAEGPTFLSIGSAWVSISHLQSIKATDIIFAGIAFSVYKIIDGIVMMIRCEEITGPVDQIDE